jgi:flavin reductase (DIM6/NTAB) family NADH-FMN oxidoreductase RutF
MPIDPRAYRDVIGTFATGVTVITMPTSGGSGAWGMTANSVTSLSLDPTLVLVCIDKSTRTHQFMLESQVWAVNILAADQEAVSRTFALKDFNEAERMMASTPYHHGVTRAPIIDDCLAYLDCRTYATCVGGDHTIFLGEVVEAVVARSDARPLVFFRGRYRDLADLAP